MDYNLVILDKSTIKLDREIYSRKFFNKTVGIEFEEFTKKEDTFSVAQFFQLYNALFFDIPRLGAESHITIRRRSNEFLRGYSVVDPRDGTIDTLNDKILKLEQQLLLANQADPEHPFFKNNTLLATGIGGTRSTTFYYMDKGYKRKVNYTPQFFTTLLQVLGYEDSNAYPAASHLQLQQIKSGPPLTEGNLEQPSYIENGELLIGVSVTDDTKDNQIQQLQDRIRQIEEGDFSSLPSLDAVSIDLSEVDGIANDVRNKVDSGLNVLTSGLPDIIQNSNAFQNLIDKISDLVGDKVREKLQSFLNYANTQG